MGAVLLSTGCVTLGPRHGGSTSEGARALSTLREAGATVPPLDARSSLASMEAGEHAFSSGVHEQERLRRRRSARGLGSSSALESPGEASADEVASTGLVPEEPPSCGGQAVPPGWPDFASSREELLAPFLTCTSPGEVLALQERVDMPRLLEALDDWRAVRFGALGPPREDVARLLNEKRTALLVKAPEAYGRLYSAVLAVFIVDSAYDDDLREILFLLARDKRLEETLALLPAFQVALEKRGLKPKARVDRDSEFGDVGRGVLRFGADALSSTLVSDGGRELAFFPIRSQLPPEYQEALARAQRELVEHASVGTLALSAFDDLTFGVPLGGYHFAANSLHGVRLLWQGEWEQGTREVAPALVLAFVAGGKGVRHLAKGEGATGGRLRTGLEAVEARLRTLTETARQLHGLLGPEGLRQVVRDIRASREAGRFVAAGGADAALALLEAGGNVARARPLMSRARPGASGSPVKSGERASTGKATAAADDAARPFPKQAPVTEGLGTLASLVDEGAGHTLPVVEAKLAAAELEAAGLRLPKDVRVLEQHRPSLEAPPPEAQGNPRWREYVEYYNTRFKEVESGTAAEGPLKWAPYEQLRGWFARGLAFERDMVRMLQEDAKKPRAQRSFLGDFDRPRIEIQVGVRKPGTGLRYADVLVIEEGALGGGPRRVESFSFKSRDLSGLGEKALKAQMIEDASEALQKYGEALDIRRGSLQSLLPGSGEVQVSRVRLIYEGGKPMPKNVDLLKTAVDETKAAVPGVEVVFQ
ncbi:hypothetical protein OV287_00345 [Archangium sp. miwbw1]|uniref:Lipoprotein n=2 Tax=Archangium lansingense TaxID=2995310 RepID=A0ABT3ZU34_9BACT|nr:hypothetical protein [Archangium lansinium]MCY1072917.1 hypothetical protein [Archangium lansinium]